MTLIRPGTHFEGKACLMAESFVVRFSRFEQHSNTLSTDLAGVVNQNGGKFGGVVKQNGEFGGTEHQEKLRGFE